MRVRLLNLWQKVQSSLWFVPTCMGLGALLLAILASQADKLLSSSPIGWAHIFLYSGDLDGARTVLGTVAGSVITVAGVTFSVTMVALSLASSQFGPRLLVNFMRNRSNQLVLGTFIGTFVFCLLALATGPTQDMPDLVPKASATMGLLLAVVSMGILVYFIHSISSSIRAENVIADIAADLERSMDRLLARRRSEFAGAVSAFSEPEKATPSALVTACRNGYIQAVDEDGLVDIARREDLLIKTLRRPGHFVVAGDPLVAIVGQSAPPEALQARVHRCFILGRQRSGEQDPEYGIHQLVEVAVRALSPGVNDPYTAISCVDWLGAIICRISDSPLPSSVRYDADGELRLAGNPVTYAGILEAAFDQIRQSARSTPAVSMRILETLATIGQHVSTADRRPIIREQADMTYQAATDAGLQKADLDDLEERYQAVKQAIGQ